MLSMRSMILFEELSSLWDSAGKEIGLAILSGKYKPEKLMVFIKLRHMSLGTCSLLIDAF